MQRPIKFRGKTEAGEWVYGDLINTLSGPSIKRKIDFSTICSVKGNKTRFISGTYAECYLVIPESVSQFTGLKSKDGTDIYEGDILKGQDGINDFVVYSENKFILMPQGDDCIYWDRSEVIGNLIDNPDLLP
jgi:hypothetical protein